MKNTILKMFLITIILIISISCNADINNTKKTYNEGVDFMNNYKTPFALDKFYGIIENYPESEYTPKSIYKIMQIYYFFDEYDKIIECYTKHKKIIEKHENKNIESVGDIYPYILSAYENLGEYRKVLNYSNYSGLFNNDNNEKILQYLASASLKLDKYSLFKEYDKKITDKFTKVGLGFILLEKSKIELAFNHFNYFLISLDEEDLSQLEVSRILNQLSNIYLKYEKGKEFQQKLADVLDNCSYKKNNIDKALLVLGKVEVEIGLYKKAKETFNKVKEYYPDSEIMRNFDEIIEEINSLEKSK